MMHMCCTKFSSTPKNLQAFYCGSDLNISLRNQASMALFLSDNIHQGDELFSVHSRGKQCSFMSLSVLLTARNIPLSAWSCATFNNVLTQGDKMYLRALNNGLLVLDPVVEFLSIDNLPTIVTVNNSCTMTNGGIDLAMEVDQDINLPVDVAQNVIYTWR